MTKTQNTDPTPHLLHVTERGMHLHWQLGAAVPEIQSAGRAARAFAGKDLVHAPSDPVPVGHAIGWFRFGVDESGNAVVGSQVKTL